MFATCSLRSWKKKGEAKAQISDDLDRQWRRHIAFSRYRCGGAVEKTFVANEEYLVCADTEASISIVTSPSCDCLIELMLD